MGPVRLRGKILLGVALVVMVLIPVGLVGFNTFRAHLMAHIFSTMKPPPETIEATTAETATVPQGLTAIGTLQAVHQVTVAPEVGGRVVDILFTAGAQVHAHDPLVQLNDGPEQGDLANYKAQAVNAEVNLARSQKLVGRQFETQVNVDLNRAQLGQANGLIAKTQAQIAQKLIRAPFDGRLGIRQIDLGQYLSAGSAIVTLTDLDQLYVNFSLPEQALSQLSSGQTVDIAVDAYPGQVFKAVLTTIEPQISVDTRAISLQATLANPRHLLQPGMSTNITVELPPLTNQVVVPETAVDFSLYGDAVFTVFHSDDAGKPVLKVHRSFVKTGARFNGKVVILDGVDPGQVVAKSGQLKLSNDAVVQLSSGDLLQPPATLPKD